LRFRVHVDKEQAQNINISKHCSRPVCLCMCMRVREREREGSISES